MQRCPLHRTILANATPHQLCLGDWEMETAILVQMHVKLLLNIKLFQTLLSYLHGLKLSLTFLCCLSLTLSFPTALRPSSFLPPLFLSPVLLPLLPSDTAETELQLALSQLFASHVTTVIIGASLREVCYERLQLCRNVMVFLCLVCTLGVSEVSVRVGHMREKSE